MQSKKGSDFQRLFMFGDMPGGRPETTKRSEFGQRLRQARERAGLSQAELGTKLGVSQRAVAHWERRHCSLYPEQLEGLARALGVSVEELVSRKPGKAARQRGPTGKFRKAVEAVGGLSRRQQEKIADVVLALVAQHTGR